MFQTPGPDPHPHRVLSHHVPSFPPELHFTLPVQPWPTILRWCGSSLNWVLGDYPHFGGLGIWWRPGDISSGLGRLTVVVLFLFIDFFPGTPTTFKQWNCRQGGNWYLYQPVSGHVVIRRRALYMIYVQVSWPDDHFPEALVSEHLSL